MKSAGILILCISLSSASVVHQAFIDHLEPEQLSIGSKLLPSRSKRQAAAQDGDLEGEQAVVEKATGGGRPIYPFLNKAASSLHQIDLEANCDFGTGDTIDFCQWKGISRNIEKWLPSIGENSGWLGGPPEDQTNGNREGGYALYETSKLIDNPQTQSLAFDSAMLLSPLIEPTKAIGSCIDFWYAMEGLSQDKLRILLRPPSFQLEKILDTNITNEDLHMRFMDSDGRDDIVLWETKDTTEGKWINGQVVYNFNKKHILILEGLPVGIGDSNRAYTGYITMDEINFIEATECKPFCNFEGGFCSWTQDTTDDFDWSLGRGSRNPSTGPPMDRFSFNYGIKGGGYTYIDTNYPRRPYDKARILSEVFSAQGPDTPLCMRFWTHMYGNGLGSLRVIIKPTQGEEEIIWELKGEQGNNWYQGQVTIISQSDFQIVIEAEVGNNNLGDIAIDEIALKENACPTSPQSASKYMGDCTFEVDECGWRNVEIRRRMDELDWERSMASAGRAPTIDHTLRTSLGSYMTLPRNSVQRGERGWLMSKPMKPDGKPLCLTFWYFMYDPFIEQTGPSLGSLRIIMLEQEEEGFQSETNVWELRNQQGPTWLYGQTKLMSDKTFMIIFEGLWGNSRGSEYIAIDDITFFAGECSTVPSKAETSLLNCDFTRGSCSSYTNASASTGGERWLKSTISRRPSTLGDHTYGGPVGYIYFDMFSRNNNDPPKITFMSKMVKATLDNEPICLSFWYAPVGMHAQTFLTVNRESADASTNAQDGNTETPTPLWKVAAKNVYKDRIEWMYGQVEIEANTDFKVSFVGEATKGGFALDDILVYPGPCNRRPEKESDPDAQPNAENEPTK